MNTHFELNISAMIESDAALDIIKTVAENQTGRKVSEIKPLVVEGKFNGFDVSFEQELVSQPLNTKKGFILTRFT
jgi:hypothetical protein